MNVITIFLYYYLKKNIYVSQFDDFVKNSTLVCKLQKALYELKQISRAWYKVIKEFLKKLKFTSIIANQSMFVFENKQTFICVYVDDLLLFDKNHEEPIVIKEKLIDRFKMTNLSAINHYLSIAIERKNARISLNQSIYMKNVLERLEMNNCKSYATLMNFDLSNVIMSIDSIYKVSEEIIYWYQSIVEFLMYEMTMIRFDLSYALFILSRYYTNLDAIHIKAAQRVLRYMKETLEYEIHYEEISKLKKFIDVEYVDVKNDRRFIEEWVFFLSENSISWSSRRQDLVTQSICESKYVALSETRKEAVWLRSLLLQMHVTLKIFIVLWANNQRTIALSENLEFHRRTKHIDIKYHWVRETLQDEKILLKYILTKLIIVDDLTKILFSIKFERFLSMLNMLHWRVKESANQTLKALFAWRTIT